MDEEAILKKSCNMVLRLLTYRDRSCKELHEHLLRKGFTETVIEKTIKKMKEFGYLDDQKYTADYIRCKKYSGYGLKKIQYELILKGIDRDIVDSLIEEKFNEEEDLARIKALLDRRIKTGDRIGEKWLVRQAMFLKRRGFQEHLIRKALIEYPVNSHIFSE